MLSELGHPGQADRQQTGGCRSLENRSKKQSEGDLSGGTTGLPLVAHLTHLQHTWPSCGTLALPGPLAAHLVHLTHLQPTCSTLAPHLAHLLRDVDQVCQVCQVCCKSKFAKCASTLAIG